MLTKPGVFHAESEGEDVTRPGGSVLLILVAGSYLLLQLIFVGVHRAPSWDESIYLSQVMKGARALPFAPSRARGITLLVLPVASLTSSIDLIRFAMMIVSSAGLFFAFRVWLPVIGTKASAIAAALFGFSWISLFYGSAVMPNLIAALLGVAGTGYLARSVGDHCQPHDRLNAGTAVALMALVRPPDALLLAAIGAVYLVWKQLGRSLWGVVAVIGGVVAGALAWLLEMSIRFGGPLPAIRDASGVSHVSAWGIPQRLTQYLSLADGPTLGPVRTTAFSAFAMVWLVSFVVLIAIGVTERDRATVSLVAIVGAGLTTAYLFLITGLAPRFLLPGFGQLSVVAGVGATTLFAGRVRQGRVVAIAATSLGCALLGWNVSVAHRNEVQIAAAEAQPRSVGLAIKTQIRSAPCAVISTVSYPEIGLAASCEARPISSPAAATWATSVASDGWSSFVVTRGDPVALPPGWTLRPVTAPAGWSIFAIAHG